MEYIPNPIPAVRSGTLEGKFPLVTQNTVLCRSACEDGPGGGPRDCDDKAGSGGGGGRRGHPGAVRRGVGSGGQAGGRGGRGKEQHRAAGQESTLRGDRSRAPGKLFGPPNGDKITVQEMILTILCGAVRCGKVGWGWVGGWVGVEWGLRCSAGPESDPKGVTFYGES